MENVTDAELDIYEAGWLRAHAIERGVDGADTDAIEEYASRTAGCRGRS